MLIDGRYEYSPWVAPSLLARCGGVELGKRETLPAGHAFDTALPGWAWRVVMPTDPSGCDAKPRD